jgi:predicted Zn-dependent protease
MIQLALAELKRGRAAEALPFAEKAAALAPNVPASHVALGRALLALGQIERAVVEMEVAVRLAPEIPKVRYGLIQAYRRAGRLDDAAREQKEFQKLQSASADGPGEDDEGVPSP